jgi:hypothetical protein
VRRAPDPLLDHQPNFASAIDSAGLVVVKRRSPLPVERRSDAFDQIDRLREIGRVLRQLGR